MFRNFPKHLRQTELEDFRATKDLWVRTSAPIPLKPIDTDEISFLQHVIKNGIPYNIYYRQTSNISRTLVGNTIDDHSDVVGASAVGAAPTICSFST